MEGARLATGADAIRCAELCQEALDTLQQARGGPLFARRESGLVVKALLRPGGLDRVLSDRRRRVLVGLLDDAVVGLALGLTEAVGDISIGVIEGLYVEPQGRGVGVGASLLESLMSWFAASHCRGVDSSALPGDRGVKNFFEAAGFKARLITMHRELG
jgi:GNAT superfamily N-acetyltransferase